MPWSQGLDVIFVTRDSPQPFWTLALQAERAEATAARQVLEGEGLSIPRALLLLPQTSSSLSLTPLSKHQEQQPLALEKSRAYVSLDQSKAKQNKKAIHTSHCMASAISYDFSMPQNALDELSK